MVKFSRDTAEEIIKSLHRIPVFHKGGAKMDSISSSSSTATCSWDNAAVTQSYNALQFSKIAASSTESKGITIFTDEGDKVTLSYDQQMQASYADLKALSYQGNFTISENQAAVKEILSRIQRESFQLEESRNLIITVDGDLNAQELADIQKAINAIDGIMTDLLQGGSISDAMTEAAGIRDLESIASLEADYRYEKAVWVEKITLQESEAYTGYGMPEDFMPDKHGTSISFHNFIYN